MPDRVGTLRLELGDVGLDPLDPGGRRSEPGTRLGKGAGGKVQNAQVPIAFLEQVVDQGRRATAYIQNRRFARRSCRANQCQRFRRRRLVPGDLGRLTARVGMLPVRFARFVQSETPSPAIFMVAGPPGNPLRPEEISLPL